MAISEYEVTEAQKEYCAVTAMRGAVAEISAKYGIPYEDALLNFTDSRVYGALFDFSTEIWKEGPSYLANIYDKCRHKANAE